MKGFSSEPGDRVPTACEHIFPGATWDFSAAEYQSPPPPPGVLISDLPVSKGKTTSGPNTRLCLELSRTIKSKSFLPLWAFWWLFNVLRERASVVDYNLVLLRLALHSQRTIQREDRKLMWPLQNKRQASHSSPCCRNGTSIPVELCVFFKSIQGKRTSASTSTPHTGYLEQSQLLA